MRYIPGDDSMIRLTLPPWVTLNNRTAVFAINHALKALYCIECALGVPSLVARTPRCTTWANINPNTSMETMNDVAHHLVGVPNCEVADTRIVLRPNYARGGPGHLCCRL